MSMRAAFVFVAAALSVVALACSSDDAADLCEGHGTDCGGVCVDLDVDVANCGKCGATCTADQSCNSGNCRAKPVADASRD